MSWIQNLFRSSPIKPMQEHMRAAVACAVKIEELFEAMTTGDCEAIARVRREIDELEHEADRIKNEIRANLPGRLLLAMERRDMLAILDAQDDIADMAQDIAGLADQRGMMTPEALREPMLALVAKTLATCRQAETIVNELDELVEAGFKGREVTRVEEMIASLARIESDTDHPRRLPAGARRPGRRPRSHRRSSAPPRRPRTGRRAGPAWRWRPAGSGAG
jgi:predicted phosphate transport protein (TIGR00153 family)